MIPSQPFNIPQPAITQNLPSGKPLMSSQAEVSRFFDSRSESNL